MSGGGGCFQAVSSLQFEGLEALVDCVTTLVGFLLGLYLSTSLNRWWTLRQQLALLSGAVVELLTLCSSCCQCSCCEGPRGGDSGEAGRGAAAAAPWSVRTGEPARWDAKTVALRAPPSAESKCSPKATCREWAIARVHRLGLASYHLTFDDAQGKADIQYLVGRPAEKAQRPRAAGGPSPLWLLQRSALRSLPSADEGLLSPAEAKCLLAVVPRPSAVWLWLSTLGSQLAGSNRLLFGPNTLRRWLEVCARVRCFKRLLNFSSARASRF